MSQRCKTATMKPQFLNRIVSGKRLIGRSCRRYGFLLVMLSYFAVSPLAQAVTPAPDGGYPNENTAEGDSALNSLNVNGSFGVNTAVGWKALFSDVSGAFNTAIGAAALFSNTA